MHLFSRKNLAITALMMMLLCALMLFNGGSSAYAATSHGISANSHAVTNSTVRPAVPAGCPSGYFCIYPTSSCSGTPSNTYYYYGTYKLYNQYGNHCIFNNQTGSAVVWYCTDSYGNTCPSYSWAGAWGDVDLTPINSIKLAPSL
ncbi:hypothetical protein [Dictyobacter aurantiacus]|uniref:hypothetical protein n=1 Tax=Dictyobacter aurantiacus TaxID=1936993 RepID=UPI001C3F696C|nr:hypothetical protein [Dictyobacter aurantiacus]